MRDPRLDRLAEVVVGHCARVRPDDLVTIVGPTTCMDAVEALFEASLRVGGHPSFHAKPAALQEILLRRGSDAQLRHGCPVERFRLERCDVLIVLICPENSRHLSRIDPARAAMAQAARRELIAMSMDRALGGRMRYCLTEIPSQGAAQDAEMSLGEYADLVYQAGALHMDDPVAYWNRLRSQGDRAIEDLAGTRELRFVAPACDGWGGTRRHDGTDLVVDVTGGTWLNRAADENFPDGEVETGPRGAEGVVNYTFPSIMRGVRVDGIRLKFRGGRVVDASAAVGQDHLIAMLDMDAGSRTMCEIALGTNYHLTTGWGNAFFDEKIGGTFHAAVGAGHPRSGNANRSGLHWDMVCDLRPGAAGAGSPGGTVHADGRLIQRDGVFVMPGWPGSAPSRP